MSEEQRVARRESVLSFSQMSSLSFSWSPTFLHTTHTNARLTTPKTMELKLNRNADLYRGFDLCGSAAAAILRRPLEVRPRYSHIFRVGPPEAIPPEKTRASSPEGDHVGPAAELGFAAGAGSCSRRSAPAVASRGGGAVEPGPALPHPTPTVCCNMYSYTLPPV